jgi:hypothetical protein
MFINLLLKHLNDNYSPMRGYASKFGLRGIENRLLWHLAERTYQTFWQHLVIIYKLDML